MAMASLLLLLSSSLLTFSLLLPPSSSISTDTVANAAEVLSDVGFTAMSLTLPLVAHSLISAVPSATFFTPSDYSFSLSLSSGQPSFSLLQFHFCPHRYSFADLHSLTFGAQISTFLPNRPITIKNSIVDDEVSVNGVKVSESPVFDDGFLAIFKIEKFLNPNFRFRRSVVSPSPVPIPSISCPPPTHGGSYAVEAMRLRGFTSMAAFLDLQLSQFSNDSKITVFAPSDVAMEGHFGNHSDWPWGSEAASLIRRHVVPCEVIWGDFMASGDGVSVVLSTFLEGFLINVTHSGDSVLVNGGIPVEFPEVYSGDGVVVYGLSRVLEMPQKSDDGRENVGGGGTASAPDWMYEF